MLKFIVVVAFAAACQGAEFEITNREGGPIWVGIQSNDGKPPLERGGFALQVGQSVRTVTYLSYCSGFKNNFFFREPSLLLTTGPGASGPGLGVMPTQNTA